MAATVTLISEGGGPTDRRRLGNAGDRLLDVEFTVNMGTYATNGVAVPSQLLANGIFTEVLYIEFIPTSLTYYLVHDKANDKIVAYTRSNDTEVADTTDLSAVTFYARAVGEVIMAITFAIHGISEQVVPGNSPVQDSKLVTVFGKFTMDASYAGSGGEAFDLSDYMDVGKGMIIEPSDTQFYRGTFDANEATGKVKALDINFVVQSSGAIGSNMEIGLSADANTASLQGGTGVTAARTLDTDTTPCVLGETAATTDLSTSGASLEFIAWGTKNG